SALLMVSARAAFQRCSWRFLFLEFLMHVVPKVMEAIPMGTMWKYCLNTLNESLLTIRENGENPRDKVRDSMSFDSLVQLSDKPEPVVVVLRVNNRISQRKQCAGRVDTSGSKEDALILTFEVRAVKTKDRATKTETRGAGTVAHEHASKLVFRCE